MAESRPRHHGGCHGHGHGKGGRLDRLEAKLADLPLAPEQREAAEQVMAQARAEREAQGEQVGEARRALRDLLEQDAPVLDEVMAQADVLGALETDSHKAKLRTMIELRAVLGPEAWQELKDSLRHRKRGRAEES
jgi:Spy/CpxP family protein refolding chaperone